MYTKQQIAAWLERIHYDGDLTISKETLDALVYSHQCAIPFENIDVYDFHREIPLDEVSLFEKMVTRKRGGYCFETNGFFCRMLQSIGFDARPCLCRVMFGLRRPEENFIDHRATIVALDGQRYFCEAGIGGAMPPGALQLPPERSADRADRPERAEGTADSSGCPERAEGIAGCPERAEGSAGSADCPERVKGSAGSANCPEGTWQEMRGEYFCVRRIERNWYGTIRRVNLSRDIYEDPMDRRERLEIMFCDAAAHEIDFVTLNHFLSQSDQSKFRRERIVNLRTPDGYRALTNRTYREVSRGRRTERELDAAEIPGILKDKFGLEIKMNGAAGGF
ncbi:MAG: arylamine N-acetyltransferase [Clostridiales bacterium]|nr:arylamine N-acetyltransferase [Clostridiales bacterium]